MRVFNKFLEDGVAYLKPFLVSKVKQLNYHWKICSNKASVWLGSYLEEITKMTWYVIDIRQQFKSRNIAKGFMYRISYNVFVQKVENNGEITENNGAGVIIYIWKDAASTLLTKNLFNKTFKTDF